MIVHILGPRRIGCWGSARYATGCTLLPSGDEDDDLIIAGPYDPKTGKLREGWVERITRLRERLDGVNVEETNDRGEADGTASRPIEKSVPSQAR
jgi:hypothetical protein